MEERPPIDLVRPTSLASGVPYAYAAAPHGRSLYVFTAGACPLDGAGDDGRCGGPGGPVGPGHGQPWRGVA